MKKLWISFILIMSILLIACDGKKGELPEELVDKEWLFYDATLGESLVLNFYSDGSYSYHCRCGEPVGNSDVYELYTFDPERNSITLSNDYDEETAEIEVISYNEHHLMVKIDGEIKDFNLNEFDTFSNFYAEQGESYFAGYHSFARISEMSEENVTFAPHGYDPQGLYVDGPFEEYKLTENVDVSEIIITSWRTVEDDWVYEERYDKEVTELNREDIEFLVENGGGTAFVWFNDAMEIEKMLFWGETDIEE